MEQLNRFLFHRNDRVRDFESDAKNSNSYFQNRRWRLINLLERWSGFWPYQSKLQQYPLQLFHFLTLLTIFASVVNKFTEYLGNDTTMTIECTIFMAFLFGLFIKLFFASIKQYSRQKIYERIAKHFETIIDPEEVAVLNEGAERGFQYTLYYVSIICVLVVIFDCVPVLRSLYNYYFIHGELILQLPLPMNFGFDHIEYWYIIALDFVIWFTGGLTVNFAYDLSFMLQIRHAKALFQIVGICLRKALELTEEFEYETMSDEAANAAYTLISSAIDLHSECLELVKLIEGCYSMSYFIILLLSTGGFGAGIHLLSTKLHDPIETYRYGSAFMIVVMHFQVVFSRGQLIIDSAETVSIACYDCKWYSLPKQSCDLLSMMMIRTSIPCQLTGAKLFPLSMESFSKMLKAGLSYYTVFKA